MKKISLLFCLFLATFHAYSETFEGWKYINKDDGTITISGYHDKKTKKLLIPSELDGKTVVRIGEKAFKNYWWARTISIPNTVTSIGNSAFYRCSRLRNISIPSSVTSIEKAAFWNCTLAKTITLSENLISIGDSAFASSMKFKTITIPASVKSIGENAFFSCWALESINVANSNPNYSSEEGVLFDKEKTLLIQYPRARTANFYVIPSSVTALGPSAFRKAKKLKEITLPLSLSNIAHGAFNGCSNLNSIILPENLETIGRATSLNTNIKTIRIPASVYSMGHSVFSECSNLESINVNEENSNYSSEDGILFNGNKTTLIKYPSDKFADPYLFPITITKIANGAFKNCSKLMSVIIPPEVTCIDSIIFSGCPQLESTHVNEINQNYLSEDNILFNKNKTTLIRYPISKTAESYTIPENITKIADNAFSGCTNLKFIEMPQSLTEIGSSAFKDCTNLTSVEIPPTVTKIGKRAFWKCKSLTSIIIPDGITRINMQTFFFCNNLESITIPSTITTISTCAFSHCRKLKSVTIPPSVTTIMISAFGSCRSLTSVVIPSSVKKIESHAFYPGRKLKKVLFLGNSPPPAEEYIFNSSKNGLKIYYLTGAKGFFEPIWDDYNMVEIPSEEFFPDDDFDV